jgi:hypothetical protein
MEKPRQQRKAENSFKPCPCFPERGKGSCRLHHKVKQIALATDWKLQL